ncbi:hypothetical protein HanPI659440_Chr03g0115241 [Helianthus annuus]|nr:hypothetical protein HanPI659440_Chr03g0115241 [Helianthus annuus]
MIFREPDTIEKVELAIPKKESWYVKLTPTPNRVFGENVLMAAQMSDQWPDDSTEVPVLKFQDRGVLGDFGIDLEEKKKKPKKKKIITIDAEVTSKKGGSSRAAAGAADKGTLRFCQSNLEDYVVLSDSLEGLSCIGEKKTIAASSKSSGSAGSRNPDAGATPSSIAVDNDEEEEEEEEVPVEKLISRKRSRDETTAGASVAQKASGVPIIRKQSNLRAFYKFLPVSFLTTLFFVATSF